MRFINRFTQEEIVYDTERDFLTDVYFPISGFYIKYSNKLNKLIEDTKNEPLLPYVMTENDKRRLAENPLYINCIPRFTITGYDKRVSNSRFDTALRKEFLARCNRNEGDVINFINEYHPSIIAICG